MIRMFASHPTAANILMLVVLVVGIAAVPTLQRDSFPVIPPTEVEARIAYPGASPADVEDAICLRAEEPLRAVENLVELRCDARDNLAIVTAEMREGANISVFNDDVKSAIEGITGFPEKVDKPTTRVVERAAVVASIAVTGIEDPAILFAYSDGLAERLRRDPMIAQATVSGFSEREIAIEVLSATLRAYGLTAEDIATALTRSSLDLPAGMMETREGDILVRFEGARRTAAQFATIPVRSSPLGAEITLGDVAKISSRFSDPAQAIWFNGKRAAFVTISKTEVQDSLDVMAVLQKRLEASRADAPPGVELAITGDTTSNILDRLRIITDNGIQGLVLVFVAMWLFFGFRFSFWVAMGLPVSFLGAIFVMQLFGLTINMITMVALLVAIGLLMDDAIVISENIVARRQKGDSALRAAVEGTRQVASGVLASFLTTAMIVGPLGFMAGKTGAVLKFLPIVLLITLVVSLVEAFLILPNHLHHAIHDVRPSRISRIVSGGFDSFRDRFVVPLARLTFKARYLTLGVAAFLLLVSLAPIVGGKLKFQNFPTLDSDIVEARLTLPQGTPAWRTEQRVKKILAALEKFNADYTPLQPGGAELVRNVTVTYGTNTDANESGPHLATVSADLLRAESRNTTISQIIDAWRKNTGPMPDLAALRFTDRERGVGGKPIEIRLQGDDLDELKAEAVEMSSFFRRYEGVRDVNDDLRPGKPEIVVTLKQVAAGALGVSAQSIASQLRRAFRGDTALEVADRSGILEITARPAASDRDDTSDILDMQVASADGTLIPLSAVTDIRRERGYARIHRIDGRRTVTVEGAINPDVANARELISLMKRDYLPGLAERNPDIEVTIVGETKDSATTGASLQKNLIIGIAGVFLLLAFQFRSFVQPVAVFVAIPLGVIGVVWGHMALGMQLSMPSMAGLATLAGVVVNDSILLVTFIKDRFNAGVEMAEAIESAVRDRFRPIFLTSLTTVVGLGPLLFETSTQAQFLRPIVASLAFGLTGATMLALFVTPAAFAILQDAGLIRREEPDGDRQVAGAIGRPVPGGPAFS